MRVQVDHTCPDCGDEFLVEPDGYQFVIEDTDDSDLLENYIRVSVAWSCPNAPDCTTLFRQKKYVHERLWTGYERFTSVGMESGEEFNLALEPEDSDRSICSDYGQVRTDEEE